MRIKDEKTLLIPDRRGNNRLDTLRKALADVLEDPAFLADMKQLRVAVDPQSAAYLAKIASRFGDVSPELLDRMQKALEW